MFNIVSYYKQAAPPGLLSFMSGGIYTVISHNQARTNRVCPCHLKKSLT